MVYVEVIIMTDEEKLQKHLTLIRKAAGWTTEELGQKIGVTKQTISNLENMKSKMSKTQYLAIQMVISQKIATSPDDITLANIMKMIFSSSESESINYDEIKNAISTAESAAAEKTNESAFSAGGIAGAMSLLGLGPVGAVSAAVLGATIMPWLTKALNDDKGGK